MNGGSNGLPKSTSIAEKIRFLFVGGFNTFLGFGLFSLLEFFFGSHLNEIEVLLTAHLLASCLAFYLHRRLVFRVKGSVFRDFLRFQSVFVIPLSINLFALPIGVSGFGINAYLAQGLFTVISVTITYFGHKYFSFKRSEKSQG